MMHDHELRKIALETALATGHPRHMLITEAEKVFLWLKHGIPQQGGVMTENGLISWPEWHSKNAANTPIQKVEP